LPVEFSKSLPMLLMRGREAVMRYFRSGLQEHDLTELQWRVLRALVHYGPLEATELARVTFLHLPSLSRILRDLESRDILQRTLVKTDLRRNVIRVSTKGVRLIQAIAPSSRAGYAAIEERFGARRLKMLQTMLLQLELSLSDPQRSRDVRGDHKSIWRREIDVASGTSDRAGEPTERSDTRIVDNRDNI
jgi:homoprotocatechuate degradation regulator HpaR